jgi:YegS/Rv2252/BmrU family lipid kinase
MKTGYVVNPVAGKRKSVELIPRIKEAAQKRGQETCLYITEGPGDAEKKAVAALIDGCRVVVAVGGDGTVNEVVNGIAESGAVMGVIPAGSGNDFARTLGIPLDFEEALECVLQGETRSMDVGLINGRRFVNVASVGFDAQVVLETYKIKKRIRGPLAYPLGVLKTLAGYRPFAMEIETAERTIRKQVLLAAVANGVYYGGGMKIAPEAVADDGLFDVLVVEDMPRLKILRLFPMIYSGRHLSRSEVEYFRTGKIKISCEEGHINSDGEIIGSCPVEMVMHAGGITVIVPRE